MRLGNCIGRESCLTFPFSGNYRGIGAAGQRPIECRTEIKDVCGGRERLPLHLLRGDVIRRSLDARLAKTDGATLAEVDDFDAAIEGLQDVVGLDIRVQEAEAVHVLQSFGDLDEQRHRLVDIFGARFIEAHAVDEFHDDLDFDEAEHAADAFQFYRSAKIGMCKLTGDFIFLDGLIEKTCILACVAKDALEGEGLARFLANDLINL